MPSTTADRKRAREGSILLIVWVVGGFLLTSLLAGQGIATFWAICLGGFGGMGLGAICAKAFA